MFSETEIKRLVFLLLVFLSGAFGVGLHACQCPVTTLNLNECEKYEVIFKGKVLSVKTCANKPGEALFEVEELFKGFAEKKFKVLFDCKAECFYEFKPGEEWIIYSRYKQVNTAQMDYCSRSRRYFNNSKEDYYLPTSGIDYEDELLFLRKELGLHRLVENKNTNDFTRNALPDTRQTVLVLLVSIAAIVLFYFIFTRLVK